MSAAAVGKSEYANASADALRRRWVADECPSNREMRRETDCHSEQ